MLFPDVIVLNNEISDELILEELTVKSRNVYSIDVIKSDADVIEIPTGTTNVTVAGTFGTGQMVLYIDEKEGCTPSFKTKETLGL